MQQQPGRRLQQHVHLHPRLGHVPPGRATPQADRRRAPQTAVVVGPAGEEIYVDKYGRVKVQFFWDREGKKDENSSCWIRVSRAVGRQELGHRLHTRASARR